MAKLEMDTDKLRIEGENLKGLARDYNILLNEMYDKIKNITNSAWTSENESGAASTFVNKVLSEKSNMLSLGSSMHNLGNKVIQYASNIRDSADNNL